MSNKRAIKYANISVSRAILQLSLPNPFEHGFKSRMKMSLWINVFMTTRLKQLSQGITQVNILNVLWRKCYGGGAGAVKMLVAV